MRLRRVSLSTIVAGTLVLVITVVLVVYSIVTYRADAARQRRDLKRLMDRQVNELAVALALPVWNIDRPQIDHVIEAMAQPGSVYAISAIAAGRTHGVIRDANLKIVPWDGRHEPTGMLVEQMPITFSGKPIGRVRLLATWRYVENELRAARMRIVASIAALDVLLILLIYFLLYRTVVHPLTQIERYAVAMGGGSHEPPAPLAAGSAAELVNLRSSLETMIRLLDQRYVELQEEAVRRFESEERFRTIFDSVNDAIFIHDIESGAILDVNARMCEMFGYTRQEALGLDIGALGSCEANRPMEWQARTKDGRAFWIEMNRRMAMIGGTPRMLVVARDVTQRREMEEALRRSETMSMMGSLVAGVAHEVRNPLFGIAATVDAFAAEFGSGAGAAEYMEMLREDVARLSRLMHDLLDYGRPQKIAPHVQSIEPAIAEAIRVCAPRARELDIEITQKIEGPLPFVSIDSERVVVMLKNVVENALEFSRAGSSVALTARNGSSHVVLTVTDHGPGFRSEDLPHIFEPFFTRRKGGSGLGLAIVQKIVNEHGGTIEARNGAEGGAVVEIRLPLSGSAES